MPRPKIQRCLNFDPSVYYFKPQGVPMRFLEMVKRLELKQKSLDNAKQKLIMYEHAFIQLS